MGRSSPAEGQEWDTGTKAQRPFVQLLYQKRKMNPYEFSSKPPDWYHGVDITWFYFLAGRASPALGENLRPLSLLSRGQNLPIREHGLHSRELLFSLFPESARWSSPSYLTSTSDNQLFHDSITTTLSIDLLWMWRSQELPSLFKLQLLLLLCLGIVWAYIDR